MNQLKRGEQDPLFLKNSLCLIMGLPLRDMGFYKVYKTLVVFYEAAVL